MVTIRPTQADDFDAIAALTNTYIQGTAVHFAYEPVTAAELRTQWEAARERYPWLTAEVGGPFAGFAKAGVWRSRDAYQWTTEVGIYIQPGIQGRGVGRELYALLLRRLRAAGFRSAIGGVTLPNPASVRLHQSLGFEHVGTVRQAGYKLNAWHDVAFYQKLLVDG
ncbi:MAG TPA: GNAT family N-acetyltransferase [Phycisphaerales bacterium]|nr:GNAT family N-acetyltransferase [Phycisphaerales bacterium]